MLEGTRKRSDAVPELTRILLFGGLSAAALRRLDSGTTHLEPRSGAEIFAQGAAADAVYGIVSGDGCVSIGATDRHSKKLMVEVFRVGELFGEVGVLDGRPRTASARVDGRIRMLRISASVFIDVLGETPTLGVTLARSLSQRLRRTFELFQDATFETLEIRLARQLLYLADVGARANMNDVVLEQRLRQPDLADLLGATTRSIITILNDWRSRGVVAYDSRSARLTIRDLKRMRALLE